MTDTPTPIKKPRNIFSDRRRVVTLFRVSVVLALCALAGLIGYALRGILGDIYANNFTPASVERMGAIIASVGAMLSSFVTKRHVQQIRVDVNGHFTRMLKLVAEQSHTEGKTAGTIEGLQAAGAIPSDQPPPAAVVAIPVASVPTPVAEVIDESKPKQP